MDRTDVKVFVNSLWILPEYFYHLSGENLVNAIVRTQETLVLLQREQACREYQRTGKDSKSTYR